MLQSSKVCLKRCLISGRERCTTAIPLWRNKETLLHSQEGPPRDLAMREWGACFAPLRLGRGSGGCFLRLQKTEEPLQELEEWERTEWPKATLGENEEILYTSLFFIRACVLSLEKAMATHSSVLAWRIPGTGEPSGLPSMGLHRVGHDWSNLAAAACSATQSYMTVWTVACQAPLSMDFCRQEYCCSLPFPSPGIFSTQKWKPGVLHWQADSLHCATWEALVLYSVCVNWW